MKLHPPAMRRFTSGSSVNPATAGRFSRVGRCGIVVVAVFVAVAFVLLVVQSRPVRHEARNCAIRAVVS